MALAVQDSGLSATLPPTNRIFIRGMPATVAEGTFKKSLEKYGVVAYCHLIPDKGCGFVDYQDAASAARVAADSKAAKLEIDGQKCSAARALPKLPGDIGATTEQAFMEPAPSAQALDVVVIRGHCTAVGIGIAAMYAKAKTTTLVLWDRQSRDEEALTGALVKRTFATMEEERADGVVMGKAFEFFGMGNPKCALLHIGSDKIKEANKLDQPLLNYDAVMRGTEENHIETLQSFYACVCYEPWVHAYKVTVFFLLPPANAWHWADDLCIAGLGTRRTVRADPLRTFDGSGWSVGLLQNNDAPTLNAALAYAAMNHIVLGDEFMKHQISGRILPLQMAQPGDWLLKQG